jgi:hypothetical protein
MNRRRFLGTAAAGGGLLLLRSGMLKGANAPSNKLNVALIGVWGRGLAHIKGLSSENVAALCDVDENHLAEAAAKFPQAKTYVDWRKCLDQKGLDAVVCCTTDHTHAFVANWAMNRGLHVFCEKPLGQHGRGSPRGPGQLPEEQGQAGHAVGTQRHAHPNFNRVRELIIDGAVGELKRCARGATGNFAARATCPPKAIRRQASALRSVDRAVAVPPLQPRVLLRESGYELPAMEHVLGLRHGQVGDMGSHTMDLAWNAIDAGLPTSAEATGEPFNPEVSPVELEIRTSSIRPTTGARPSTVSWYQGGAMPEPPAPSVNLKAIGHGVMFEGSRGFLVADFTSRMLIPVGDDADLTYYARRPKDKIIPPMGDFLGEWISACKGGLKTSCDFDYGGRKIEMMLLGLAAYRAGRKLDYDGASGRATPADGDNPLLRRTYRAGWSLDG